MDDEWQRILLGFAIVGVTLLLVFGIETAFAPTPEGIRGRHPTWSIETCERIAKGEIWIGMTEDMLFESWGFPDKVNTTVTASEVSKQWIYRDRNPFNPSKEVPLFGGSTWYFYFRHGILTSYQH